MSVAGNRFPDPPIAPGHHLLSSCVAEVLDGFTVRRLQQAGVSDSFRCLVIGTGTEAIAGWLAGQMGVDGVLVVTDSDPSRVPAHPGVTVLRQDLATDSLVEGQFDLIHVRAAIAYLPGRKEMLTKLAAALAPGGAIGFDELEPGGDRCLVDSPDPAGRSLFDRYHYALATVLERTGLDSQRRPIHQAMCEIGLVDVDTEVWARSWRGGEPGCLLLRTLAGQLRHQLAAAGMSGAEVDRFRRLLLDPRLVIRSCLAVSTIGRKPLPAAVERWRWRRPYGGSPFPGRVARLPRRPYRSRP